jgi:hypothetical protein
MSLYLSSTVILSKGRLWQNSKKQLAAMDLELAAKAQPTTDAALGKNNKTLSGMTQMILFIIALTVSMTCVRDVSISTETSLTGILWSA